MTPLLVLLAGAATASPSTVVVTEAAQTDALSRKEARLLFTGRRQTFSNGVPVELVLPATDSAEMRWLSEDVLGLSPPMYQRFLAEQAYRKGTAPPRNATSAAETATLAEALPLDRGLLSVVPQPPASPLLLAVTVEP